MNSHLKKKNFNNGFNPLLIADVLENIFQYFKPNDLKKLYLINHQWKQEAEKLFMKKSFLYVGFEYESEVDNSEDNQGVKCVNYLRTNINKLAKTQTTFKSQNIQINLRGQNFPYDRSIYLENVEKIVNFIETFTTDIKHLEINCNLNSLKNFPVFERILSATCVRNVQTLRLNIVLGINTIGLWETLEIKHQLFKLSRLNIYLHSISTSCLEIHSLIAEKLSKLAPNMKSLSVDTHFDNSQWTSKVTQAHQLAKEFCVQVKSNSKLTKLHLPSEETGMFMAKTLQCFNEIIQHISSRDFGAHLTSIKISFPWLKTEEDGYLVQKFVDHCAPNLQKFNFAIHRWNTSKFGLPNEHFPPIEINMPIFPKLRKLGISDYREFSKDNSNMPFNLTFRFLSESIDYNVHFPLLDEISFAENELKQQYGPMDNRWHFYDMFVPIVKNAALRVKVLSAPIFLIDWKLGKVMPRRQFVYELQKRMIKVFPNVHHAERLHAVEQYNELKNSKKPSI